MSYRIPEQVEYTLVEGDYVLMDLRSGLYFALDPVATVIWQAVEESGTREAAVERVLARFDVEEERVRQDVANLVQTLVDKGLLIEG